MWIDLFVHIVGIFAGLSLVFGAYITGLMIFDMLFKGRDESKD
ncbi:hypothetical protein [Nitrosomonas marina]|uniref:Uncharacterized protein n=1 Tax=Nitrosomonas marina TaxID=917 RepID=A0A1H8GIJ7_9PROT|nr:hypothetical protein [Nitrosomonas marina]SEN43822.1 hypothetical protein SAMN05216325_11843 [Nitrosomonas marina]